MSANDRSVEIRDPEALATRGVWALEKEVFAELGSGIASGLTDGAKHLPGTLGVFALGTASGFTIGSLGFTAPQSIVRWRGALALAAGMDVLFWATKAGGLALGTWWHPETVDLKKRQAHLMGQEAFFQGVAMIGAYGGGRAAGHYYSDQRFYKRISETFANAPAGTIPRVQSGILYGPKPINEPVNSELGQFYRKHASSVGILKGKDATATAFYADPEYGLWCTNYHAVEGSGGVQVYHNGSFHPSSIVAVDKTADLAVLHTGAIKGARPVSLANSRDLHVLDPLIVIGRPLNAPVSISKTSYDQARFTWVEGTEGKINHFQFSTFEAPFPGSSGSAVFNPAGKVVGMLASRRTWANAGYAVDADHLRAVLGRARYFMRNSTSDEVLSVDAKVIAKNPWPSIAELRKSPVRTRSEEKISGDDISFAEDLMYESIPVPPPPAWVTAKALARDIALAAAHSAGADLVMTPALLVSLTDATKSNQSPRA